jgi:very-short-patch-repair endonuclease
MNIPNQVKAHGGVVSAAALHRNGVTESEIRWAVRTGTLRRIRYGWLQTADADPAVIRAVRAGGRLGCISATRHYGIWTPEHDHLHVSLPQHAGRYARADVVAHWEGARWRDMRSPIEPVDRVIRQVVECCDRDTAIAVIDSALQLRTTTLSRVASTIATLPEQHKSLLREVDARSESGYESICRARLTRLGLRPCTQASIPGVGRVDLIVGDRLLIEVDGKEWHDRADAFLADRSRDLAAHRQGFTTVRLAPSHTTSEWQWVERVIMSIVARGEHMWSARQRRFRANNGFGG